MSPGTYRLHTNSPCIDSGMWLTSAPYNISTDIDGESRSNPPDKGCDEAIFGAGSGIAEYWADQYFTTVPSDSSDADSDGRTNLQEYQDGTSPTAADTDDDGLNDGEEASEGVSPLQEDSDGDGMPDAWEIEHGLNPNVDDSHGDADGDGLENGLECVSE